MKRFFISVLCFLLVYETCLTMEERADAHDSGTSSSRHVLNFDHETLNALLINDQRKLDAHFADNAEKREKRRQKKGKNLSPNASDDEEESEEELPEQDSKKKDKREKKNLNRQKMLFFSYIKQDSTNLSLPEKFHLKFLSKIKLKDLNMEDKGETALHYAVKNNHLNIFKELVNKADISKANFDGETALHYAALAGRSEMVKILIEKGADPFIETETGYNCFEYAENLIEFLENNQQQYEDDPNLINDLKKVKLYFDANFKRESSIEQIAPENISKTEEISEGFESDLQSSISSEASTDYDYSEYSETDSSEEELQRDLIEFSDQVPEDWGAPPIVKHDPVDFNLLDNTKKIDQSDVNDVIEIQAKVPLLKIEASNENQKKTGWSLLKSPKKAIFYFCCFSALTYLAYKILSKRFESKENINT